MRWSLQLAEPPADSPAGFGFHALLVPEGEWSSDGRMIAADALSVRQGPNRLPLMGLIENTPEHERAVNVGSFERIERTSGGMWEGWGNWADSVEADQIRRAVRAGDVTGVSVDLAVSEAEYLMPAGDDEAMLLADGGEPPTETIDGVDYLVVEMPTPRMRALAGEILGATIVPFPAFGGCTISDLRPDDELVIVSDEAIAAAAAPNDPPRVWFEHDFEPGAPLTVSDEGRVFGYIAGFDDCHISYPDRCVAPPRSATNYAHFLTGEVRCSDGSRVPVGQIARRGGHAELTMSAARAKAFYDDTDSAVADVTCGEDDYGIWVAGALVPGAEPADVRRLMASAPSGDWRRIGASQELIAISAVNTPGFTPRTRSLERDGLVAAMVAPMQPPEPDLEPVVERIAASIGRSSAQRRAALYERVHA